MAGILTAAVASTFGANADPYFNYTTLLLPGTGTNGAQNNTFLDSSSNTFTITRNGNTTQGTFSPFSQTGWSSAFNTSTTYLTVTDTANLRFGSSNFTIEAWVYRNASGATQTIASKGASTPTGWVFQISSADKLVFTDTSTSITGTTSIAANTWTYVAVVRAGTGSNQTTLYVNGTSDGTGTSATTFNQTNNMLIGADRSTTNFANGYISNLRLSNTNRTISSTPTTALTADANTIFLSLNINRYQYTDSTAAFTNMSVTGTPSVQSFSPFAPTAAWSSTTNGGSGYFDGNGDYLSAPASNITDFATGQAFTFECWFYTTSTAYQSLIRSTNGFFCDFTGTSVGYGKAGVAYIINPAATVNLNQWNHFAVSRNTSNQSRLWLNGVTAGSNSSDNYSFSNDSVIIGLAAGSYLSGYISGMRVVKGTAVYDPTQTSITVPTAPLTAITNTSLLLNFTNAGIYDATSKNDLETVGNAQISTTQSKWGGSSMAFDGTGDWLLSAPNVTNDFGTGNFTIEAWIYMTSTSNYFYIYNSSNANFNSPNFTFLYDTSLGLRMYAHSGIYTVNQGSTSGWVANTWYYVALVRNGGTITLYRNNTSLASGSTFSGVSFGSATAIPQIGGSSPDSRSNNGYIQDLRVSRYARDVTTTPTAAFPLL